MKTYKKSPLTIVCYVVAALVAVYFVVSLVSAYSSIYSYYADYGMTPGFRETFIYLLQTGVTPLVQAVVVFMAGYILDQVRKLDPANWKEAAAEVAGDVDEVVAAAEKAAEEAADTVAEVEEFAAEAEEVAVDAAEVAADAAEL